MCQLLNGDCVPYSTVHANTPTGYSDALKKAEKQNQCEHQSRYQNFFQISTNKLQDEICPNRYGHSRYWQGKAPTFTSCLGSWEEFSGTKTASIDRSTNGSLCFRTQSTYCRVIQEHCAAAGRSVRVANLDPAAENFGYQVCCWIDLLQQRQPEWRQVVNSCYRRARRWRHSYT